MTCSFFNISDGRFFEMNILCWFPLPWFMHSPKQKSSRKEKCPMTKIWIGLSAYLFSCQMTIIKDGFKRKRFLFSSLLILFFYGLVPWLFYSIEYAYQRYIWTKIQPFLINVIFCVYGQFKSVYQKVVQTDRLCPFIRHFEILRKQSM